jgi:hypothetical protein
MLYREINAVCSQIHTNKLSGQNVEFVNVKLGGTYSNHWASLYAVFISYLNCRRFCLEKLRKNRPNLWKAIRFVMHAYEIWYWFFEQLSRKFEFR